MEWISVKDRLPDENKNEYFLVVVDINGDIHFDVHYDHNSEVGSFELCDNSDDLEEVTHWIDMNLVGNYLIKTLPEEAKANKINCIKNQIARYERFNSSYKKQLSNLGVEILISQPMSESLEKDSYEEDSNEDRIDSLEARVQLLEDAHGNANIGRFLYNKYNDNKKGS